MGSLGIAIEELRAEDLLSMSPDRLAETVIELRRDLDWLEVEWSRRVAAFAEVDGIALEGHSSMTAFLKHRCRMSASRAQGSVTLAHKLGALEYVGKAFAAGDVSLDQARILTRVPDRLDDELVRDEMMLVNAAAPLQVSDTRRLVEYWKSVVDGPGCDADADELVKKRYLHASRTFEGMVKVDGLLDPAAGDLLLTALDAATAPPGADDPRTARQRRVDALSDVARSFLDSGKAAGREKPHILVLTDLDALHGHGGGVHETSDGQILTPEQVRQYACDCTISRVVFDPGSVPIDIGRATRVIPAAMRRAVIARDRHCQHSGCDRAARWCDVHHITHWVDGGPTALWNLTLLCRFHHTLEHRKKHPRRRAARHEPSEGLAGEEAEVRSLGLDDLGSPGEGVVPAGSGGGVADRHRDVDRRRQLGETT